jgi:hypothetical protein
MPNYLTQIQNDFYSAKKKLEKALDVTTKSPRVEVLQNMTITDELAEVFREKPVIIIQSMDIKFVQINNLVMAALRHLDRIDNRALKAIGTKDDEQSG